MAGSTDDTDLLKSTSTSDSMELEKMDGDKDAEDLDNLSDYDDQDIYEDYEGFDEYSLLQSQFDNVDLPSGVEASVPWFSVSEAEKKESASSSSTVGAESSSNVEDENDYLTTVLSQFKQFDVVEDFLDHYYAKKTFSEVKVKLVT